MGRVFALWHVEAYRRPDDQCRLKAKQNEERQAKARAKHPRGPIEGFGG
jgi:hypothetical protein